MNDQLPRIDPDLRQQLARRAAGRVPEDLLGSVSAAVRAIPQARPRPWIDGRVPWRTPRIVVAAASLAVVAALAVGLVALPAILLTRSESATVPAGYPTDRALTTSELAAIMAGPSLPANTALVAAVTIDVQNNVCPMNRWATIGVVEGMGSQVCVMTASQIQIQPYAIAGVFAFRYIGPGVLGMLGEITAASSSTVAFRATGDWPLAGKTFLVDGWLGATELTVSCAEPPMAGDPLAPNGEDCPFDDWLGDDATAPGIVADHGFIPGSLVPGYDTLSLRGNARHVEAGGMRQIDAIDHAAAVRGVYVVRAVAGPCAGDPPTSSRACSSWRVLARAAEITIPVARLTDPALPASPTPEPAATPMSAPPLTVPPATPVAEPSGVLAPAAAGLFGSGDRPLSQAEFAALWAADPNHLADRVVVVKGPISTGFECSGAGWTSSNPVSPLPCYPNVVAGQIAAEGYWAVRVGADGMLGVIGELWTPAAGFVFSLDDASTAWNAPGGSDRPALVDAWIGGMGADSCDVAGQPCYEVSWLAAEPYGPQLSVQLGAYHRFGAGDVGGGSEIHAIFLVRSKAGAAEVLARMETATP